jgi:hypothetical protein
MSTNKFSHHTTFVNDIRLHYVTAGKGDPSEEQPEYFLEQLLVFFGEG